MGDIRFRIASLVRWFVIFKQAIFDLLVDKPNHIISQLRQRSYFLHGHHYGIVSGVFPIATHDVMPNRHRFEEFVNFIGEGCRQHFLLELPGRREIMKTKTVYRVIDKFINSIIDSKYFADRLLLGVLERIMAFDKSPKNSIALENLLPKRVTQIRFHDGDDIRVQHSRQGTVVRC